MLLYTYDDTYILYTLGNTGNVLFKQCQALISLFLLPW